MSSVIWHDVECSAYAADLSLWEELAGEADGPILDLGCGTGRVALHLAKREHRVSGLDLDAELVAAFNQRAEGLPTQALVADARDFDLDRGFELVLAPMQLVQLLSGRAERASCLRCIESHLQPNGTAALAIVEGVQAGTGESFEQPPPDARESDGWVYSSLPLQTAVDAEEIVVRRLRQTVSPGGELSDEKNEIRLQTISAEALEGEAKESGLRPIGRRSIAATDEHIGSTVVLLGKGS